MQSKRFCCCALGLLFFIFTVRPVSLAQTSTPNVDQRIADLEKQLESLRGELEALKKSAPAAPEATMPADHMASMPAASAAAAAPAAKPDPLAGISSVLGGATISGLVDAYYGYNANHPNQAAPTAGFPTEPFLATNQQFSLNLIEIQLDKSVDKESPLGYRVALAWGQAINAVNITDPGGLGLAQNLKEGYLSYLAPIGKGLQIDVGKFVTPFGAEVIESNQNWNYSRSLLFNYAIPYYHFGARAKYTFNDKYSLTLFAVNGTNNIVDNNTAKTGGFSFGWNPTKKLSITQNYFAGPEQTLDNRDWRHLSDTVIAYTATPKLSLMANVDYGREMRVSGTNSAADWSGIAGYAKYAVSPKVAVAGRYEYFNDHDGYATGFAQHLNEFTGTVERKFATHLISRLEYRHDSSNHDFFNRGGTSFVQGQNTVDAGLIFVLEPSESK